MKSYLAVLLFLSLAMQAQNNPKPTVAEAEQFMKQAEIRLNEQVVKASRAGWVQENFITSDTEALSADAQDQLTALIQELVDGAKRFDGLKMSPDLSRKFMLLKLQL